MFKRYTRKAGETVKCAKDLVSDDEEKEDVESDSDEDSNTDKAVDLTESFFGVSGAQRTWAQRLGTDPYSTNEVLQAAIKEVALQLGDIASDAGGFWFLGTASERTQYELSRLGFAVHENIASMMVEPAAE